MLLAAPALIALAAVQFPFVREPVEIVNYPGFALDGSTHDLAVADGQAVAVWSREHQNASVQGHHIWAAASGDSGRTWSNIFRADLGAPLAPRFLGDGAVTVADGQVQLCWMEGYGGSGLYFSTWPIDTQPSAPGQLILNDEIYHYIMRTSADGQRVAVLAHSSPSGGLQRLVVVTSDDGGVTFQPPVELIAGTFGVGNFGGFGGMDLEIVGDELHVVWNLHAVAPAWNGEQYYQFSADGGATWLPADRLIASGRFVDPELVVDGSRAAVVTGDETVGNRISSVLSTDGGATWSIPGAVASASHSVNARRLKPRAHYTPTHLVVAWSDDRSGLDAPLAAWSDDGGATWLEEQLHPTFGTGVQLAGDPATGNFAAFWNGGAQIYTKWSRSTMPNPDLTLTIAADNSVSFEGLRLRDDPIYNDFVCTWQTLDAATSTRKVWAAGFRTPQVEPLGNFQPGGQVGFVVSGFPDQEIGYGLQVLVSSNPGMVDLPFGDGRRTGLGVSLMLQQTANSPLFRGQIGAFGGGATGPVVLPLTIPSGTVLHCEAVSFSAAGTEFGSITDYVTVVVQ